MMFEVNSLCKNVQKNNAISLEYMWDIVLRNCALHVQQTNYLPFDIYAPTRRIQPTAAAQQWYFNYFLYSPTKH